MNAFPAFVPLTGAVVVVAGDGEPAAAKARLFDGSPATLRRVAEADAGVEATYAGARLAFVAVEAGAERAAAAARAAGAWVNVVDRPELCDFTTPAIVDRGAVVGAIGTGGTAPVLATILRGELETAWPADLGERAARAASLRAAMAGMTPRARRGFLRDLLRGPALAEAEALARLARFVAPPGRTVAIDAAGPAEALRVRDLRALAEADVLVIEPGCDPAVVAFGRRDARREPPGYAPAEGEVVIVLRAAPTR